MQKSNTPKHHFLQIADFELGTIPSNSFTLTAQCLDIDGEKQRNVILNAKYDRHMRLRLSGKIKLDPKRSIVGCDEVSISGSEILKPVKLLATSISLQHPSFAEIDFVLAEEPFLLNFGGNAQKVEAIVINGPPLFFRPYVGKFELDDFTITLSDFPSTFNRRGESRDLKYESVPTGTLTLQRSDGSPISSEAALYAINHFNRFLTFVRGGYCGLGNVMARDAQGDLVFAYLGFTPTDSFEVGASWCNIDVVKKLPEIYQKYQCAVSNEENAIVTLRAVEFYRASNVARDSSLEMGLVASQAALDTIISYLLIQNAGWSKNKIEKNSSFHRRLCAATKQVGLVCDPLEHSPELNKKLVAETERNVWKFISNFRNGIVHQGKSFEYTGLELYEIWEVYQWFCEVFLFYLIGYRGKMYDRRRYQGWRGPAVQVPISIESNAQENL